MCGNSDWARSGEWLGWAGLVTRSGDVLGLREARRRLWDTLTGSGAVASPVAGEAGKGQEASAQGRCDHLPRRPWTLF